LEWSRLGAPSRLLLVAVALPGAACGRRAPPVVGADAAAQDAAAGSIIEASETLDAAQEAGMPADAAAAPAVELEYHPGRRCPKEMVDVAGRFCIDRFEDTMVDNATGERLSPHYPPEPDLAKRMFEKWQTERLNIGSAKAQEMPIPLLPSIEQKGDFLPRAVSRKGVVPQGYISGKVAAEACARAKKRLCTRDEWAFACRGEKQTKYPYGSEYTAGVCNVFRMQHPAAILHDNASIGHSDPRLGLVTVEEGPLLRTTGATPKCASRWGKDAAFDMVGNVDEWIDDPEGTFLGGFFSRSTKEGCDSFVTVHPFTHWDYSIGVRCCMAETSREDGGTP
jgi:sulfatase modifying factor 1